METERQAGKAHAAIVRRFLADTSLSPVTETDLPEGSAAHAEMLAVRHDVETESGQNAWLCHGWTCSEAFDAATAIQGRYERLSRAHQAVTTAVSVHLENRLLQLLIGVRTP